MEGLDSQETKGDEVKETVGKYLIPVEEVRRRIENPEGITSFFNCISYALYLTGFTDKEELPTYPPDKELKFKTGEFKGQSYGNVLRSELERRLERTGRVEDAILISLKFKGKIRHLAVPDPGNPNLIHERMDTKQTARSISFDDFRKNWEKRSKNSELIFYKLKQ